jgi:integrase
VPVPASTLRYSELLSISRFEHSGLTLLRFHLLAFIVYTVYNTSTQDELVYLETGFVAHLTKAVVEAAKGPTRGQRFIRDDSMKGFALRVIASGAKSFVWEGRVNGRVRRITIGQFPYISVAIARDRALGIRAAVAQGDDPCAERQAKRHEVTFGDLGQKYISEHSKIHKRSWIRDERRLARCKAWESRRTSDIHPVDVLKLQQKIAQDNGPVEANRTVELLRAVFNKAQRWGVAAHNPTIGFERFREVRRDRFLNDDELRRLRAVLSDEVEPWRSYFPLLLLLGVRRSELAGARWVDIDFDSQTLRLTRTKSGEPRLAPLPRAATELLRGLPSFRCSEYLFPGTGKTGHLVEVKCAWRRLCLKAGLIDVTIHDLRRTVGSRMAIAGVNLPTIGRVLGHLNLNATQIYARLDLEAARRALEANAQTLPVFLPILPARTRK